MSYRHGVYTSEQATALLPPVRVDVSMPVIVGTAPVHTLAAGADKPINTPRLIFSLAEYQAVFGVVPEGEDVADYTLSQAAEIYLGRYRVAPICVVNVFDPATHIGQDEEPDVGEVAAEDIIGGVDPDSGGRTGLALLDEVFPRFGIVPGQLLVPHFSTDPAVAVAMAAKCTGISGHFGCMAIADLPATLGYTEVAAHKATNNLDDPNLILFFGQPVFGGVAEPGSVHWAGITAQRDAENESIPYWSPSNRSLRANGMQQDGAELVLDPAQAAYLNGQGIVTGLAWIGGMVGWGNRTSAYPGATDIKDTFIPMRRMFHFAAATLVLTAWQLTDGPLNRRLIGTIQDTFNIWLNGLARREFILGGRVEFLQDENPTTDLMDGISRFHVYLSPPSPAREIDFTLEYDPSYIETLFEVEE